MFSKAILLAVLLLAIAVNTAQAGLSLGLAWGTDNTWAKTIAKGSIRWYWHWQEGPVSSMPSDVQFVPNFWGPKYWGKWNQRKSEMKKKLPTRILAFNEPDVSGQSDIDPSYAATLWMQELRPYQKKGVKISSPQIVWDVNWMDKFMKALKAKGAEPDFMAIHWYGSYKDIAGLKKWVAKIHNRYGKSVWLTEYGVTASSHPSAAQIKSFHIEATEWLKSTGYVKRAAWLGCYAYNDPPDAYPSRQNAFFNSNGSLRSLAKFYMYAGSSSKRDVTPALDGAAAPSRRTPGALRHSHARLHRSIAEAQEDAEELAARAEAEAWAASDDDDDEEEIPLAEGEEPEHCDEICAARQQSIGDAVDDDDALVEGQKEDVSQWVD